MNSRVIAAAALFAAVSSAPAPAQSSVRLEIRPFAGMFVPTGTQRDDFKKAAMLGFQSALEVSSYMHFLASVGWTDGRSKIGALTNDVAHIWQYDLGAEFNGVRELSYSMLFRPFIGVGAGARKYDYDAVGVGTRTCSAGYAALGSELQRKSFALRLESRGYVSCFKSPLSGEQRYRNDMSFAFGLAYHVN